MSSLTTAILDKRNARLTKRTHEWIRKAENDYRATLLLQNADEHFYDQLCFYCQQCVEKYLKGMLDAQAQIIPETYKLLTLFRLVTSHYPELRLDHQGLKYLTRYALELQSQNVFANKREADTAFRYASRIRADIRKILKLKP